MQLELILFFLGLAIICFWAEMEKVGFLVLCLIFIMAILGISFPFAIIGIAVIAFFTRD